MQQTSQSCTSVPWMSGSRYTTPGSPQYGQSTANVVSIPPSLSDSDIRTCPPTVETCGKGLRPPLPAHLRKIDEPGVHVRAHQLHPHAVANVQAFFAAHHHAFDVWPQDPDEGT